MNSPDWYSANPVATLLALNTVLIGVFADIIFL
jgi:hypothetical protein